MRERRASKTAEGVALLRAIEATRPPEKRLVYDPFARDMVNGINLMFSKLWVDLGLYDLSWHGAYEYVIARERYIDDLLKQALKDGFTQIVLLGAGFDMRAFRIEEIEKALVFEVDHPATQAAKLEKLKKLFNPIRENIKFVSIDFNTQTLEDRLAVNGFDESERTFFIWQGVTMYLTEQGVESTLKFITQHSKSGSRVVFDYFTTELMERSAAIQWTKPLLKLLGESLDFSIEDGELERYLGDRGFTHVENADSETLNRLYFAGTGKTVAKGIAIASGTVA
ncbi:SAM-dependent methyltransferase [Candidatus Obscuribacterales bacterium]|nr:SAM-dependent methyltransferase [Candidatus Obscuribacterales bacterium]